MKPILADLLHLLKLERIEHDIFRGESRDIGSPRVYGGQVLGQALSAATATVGVTTTTDAAVSRTRSDRGRRGADAGVASWSLGSLTGWPAR